MSLIKELLEILTPEQQKEIIRDFKEWSGGWSPDEADSTMKKEYIANALPSKFNAKEVEKFLMMEEKKELKILSVFIPANIYAGKYYDHRTIRVYVLAQDDNEAAQLINDNKKSVIEHISKKRISGKPAVPAKNPEKNIFFKNKYATDPATVSGSGVTVLTSSGFKQVKTLNGRLIESIDIKDLSSGFIKSPKAKEKVKDVTAGKETVIVNNKEYTSILNRAIEHTNLKKGMVVLASYNKYNQGAHIYEILGFTGTDKKYGDGGVKFNSVKEVMDSEGVKTLDELEEKQNENEYGFHTYMVVKDLDDNEEGPWFYLFEGKWSSGSGAEPLSFWLMEEV